MKRTNHRQIQFKIVAIGDSGVGKTCLLNQYVDDKVNGRFSTTVGLDIHDKTILYQSNQSLNSYQIDLRLWDTAGQERYRSLTKTFFRDADGFLLVFDITNEQTLMNLRHWIDDIRCNIDDERVAMVLVGNKSDLTEERQVNQDQALKFAEQEKLEYVETSVVENSNVKRAVDSLVETLMMRLEKNISPIDIRQTEPIRKSQTCSC